MIRLAGENKAWVGKILIGTKEQAESGLLAEGKGGIPVRVAGVDIDGLGGVDPFDPGQFGFPGTGGRAAGQFERVGRVGEGSLDPGETARVSRGKGQVECQGRVRAGSGLGAAGKEDDRSEVRRYARPEH